MNTIQAEPARVKEHPTPPPALPAPSDALASTPLQSGKSHWWVYIILILVVGGFGYFIHTRLEAAKVNGADPSKMHGGGHDLPVVVATARRGDLKQYLVGLGTVTPLATVTVKSRVDGEITEILFTEGQKVKKGQPLINIDPRPYEAALAQAKGQLAKDKAAEESADWSVQQDTIALKTKAISELQLHTDTANRDQALGAMDVDNANIVTANLNLTYSHIVAPIDGVVGLRLVDVGNIVHASDTTGLVVLTQLQPITVVFTVSEDDINQVQKRFNDGEPVVVDAYDRDYEHKLATGKLLAIDNQVDPTTGTVKIKAQFDNTDNALYPSQFVNARMLVNTIKDAVLVPSAAIQHSPTSTFAYVVTEDKSKSKDVKSADRSADQGEPKKAPTTTGSRGGQKSGVVTMRDVVVGPSQAAIGSDTDATTVVLSGLQPGDVVVTDGVDKLVEGTHVLTSQAPGATSRPTTQVSTTTMPASSQPAHHGHGKKP